MAVVDIFKKGKKWQARPQKTNRDDVEPGYPVYWFVDWNSADLDVDKEVVWVFPGYIGEKFGKEIRIEQHPTRIDELIPHDTSDGSYKYHVIIDNKLVEGTSPPRLRVRKSVVVTTSFPVNIFEPTRRKEYEQQSDGTITLELKGKILGQSEVSSDNYEWLLDGNEDAPLGYGETVNLQKSINEGDHTITLRHKQSPGYYAEVKIKVDD